jgi:uncharacterized protein YfaS (alpha-2-macroglobulin family)
VAAEVSLAVVDKALYSLVADQTPDPLETFYGNRELSFQTATSLLALNSLLQPAEGGPGSKGGSGGRSISFRQGAPQQLVPNLFSCARVLRQNSR